MLKRYSGDLKYSIRYYLNKDSRSKSKERSVVCHVHFNNRKITVSTNIKLDSKFWDSNRNIVKSEHKQSVKHNEYLSNKRTELEETIENLNQFKTNTFEDYKQAVKRIFKKEVVSTDGDNTFFGIYDKFVSVHEHTLREKTIKKFRGFRNILTEFETWNKSKLTFNLIDFEFRTNFIEFLIKIKKHNNNTITKDFTTLNIFMNWSFENEYHENLKYQRFSKLNSKEKLKKYDVPIIFLNEKEISLIRNLDLTSRPALDIVRDIFLFSCYTGARWSDVVNLRTSDIQNGIWTLFTIKTDDTLSIPLSRDALNVLSKYKDMGRFPTKSLTHTNQHIKLICKLAKINSIVKLVDRRGAIKEEQIYEKWQLISFHAGRRSYVSNSLERGMRIEILKEFTGHKKISVLQRYIGLTKQSLINEVDKISNRN